MIICLYASCVCARDSASECGLIWKLTDCLTVGFERSNVDGLFWALDVVQLAPVERRRRMCNKTGHFEFILAIEPLLFC